mgnify:CR=1 FL=1
MFMICFMLHYEFYVYGLRVRFSLPGIRLTPLCLYVQENSFGGGERFLEAWGCVLRRNGIEGLRVRFEDEVSLIMVFYVFFRNWL